MSEVLDRNLFLVKEHLGLFKAANEYDIFDPETGDKILECREPRLGMFTKILRFTDYKRMTPFGIVIQTPEGDPLVRVERGWTFMRSKVSVLTGEGTELGLFRQKLFSVGGSFQLLDPAGEPMCKLKGKWTGWDFRFLSMSDDELAHVSKKWAGIGKEMFTSADTYMLEIKDNVPPGNPIRRLILAAVMCIDMVLKE